jgi:phosphoribosyl-AMP cyclohydrolase / phosphoribosyl-ATP pyrophosphohydrolase
MTDINNFDDLYKIIQERINNRPEDSYVTTLVKSGKNKISQKIGEETMELIIEVAKDQHDRKDLINEATDLFFHLWVLLAFLNVSPLEILNELQERHTKKCKK